MAALQNFVAATDHQWDKLAVGLEAHTRISDDPWSDLFQTHPDDSKSFASLSSSFATAKDSYHPNVETGCCVVVWPCLQARLDFDRCSSFDKIFRLRYLEACSNRH